MEGTVGKTWTLIYVAARFVVASGLQGRLMTTRHRQARRTVKGSSYCDSSDGGDSSQDVEFLSSSDMPLLFRMLAYRTNASLEQIKNHGNNIVTFDLDLAYRLRALSRNIYQSARGSSLQTASIDPV